MARAAMLGWLVTMVSATIARAESREPFARGSWLIGLGTKIGTADALSVSDVRPVARGMTGAQMELAYAVGSKWLANIGGEIGGAWVDFNGPGAVGKVEDLAWAMRLGVDRVFRVGARDAVLLGVGVVNGEARSWLHTLVYNDEGPHAFFVGGAGRIGATHMLGSRFHLYGELETSVYRAHAKDPPLGTKFNWLGRSTSVLVGLRFAVARGRPN